MTRETPGGFTSPLSAEDVQALRRARAHASSLLVLLYHSDGAAVAALHPDVPLVVGREPPCDLAIDDASLSRRHARITLVEGEIIVEDLGSTNGTWLRGERIRRAVAKSGDELLLGAVTGTVRTFER